MRPASSTGSRNSFKSLHNGVDFVAYLNARPFQESESLIDPQVPERRHFRRSAARTRPPSHLPFRIGRGLSGNSDSPGAGTTPFLVLNPGAIGQAGDPPARVGRSRLLPAGPVAHRGVAIRLRRLCVPHRGVDPGPVLGLLRHGGLFPDRLRHIGQRTGSTPSGRSSRSEGERMGRGRGSSSAASAN